MRMYFTEQLQVNYCRVANSSNVKVVCRAAREKWGVWQTSAYFTEVKKMPLYTSVA